MFSRSWRPVALATGLVGLALAINEVITPGFTPLSTLLLMAVLVAALYGSRLGGWLALAFAMAGLAAIRLYQPLTVRTMAVRLAGFLVIGVATVLIADRQRKHRQQLEELREQHARLAEVMHEIGIGHWYSDLPSQRMWWDDQCKVHFGFTDSDAPVSFDDIEDRVHPEDRERVERAAERAIFSHTNCDIDFRVVLPGGTVRWLKGLGRGFYDKAGRPTRFDGITIDITRLKEVEAQLADANRLKDEFLATLSHELRTPLNAVLGWARMLASGRVSAGRVDHALAVIERNAQAQARLVEELLDLSRIESGQLRLQIEPIDVSIVVQNALEAVRPAADARGVEVSVSIDPAARWVTADADRLRQVVWNLLSNAVKFTPGGGRVSLTLEANNSAVVLRVSDTGCGISPEFLPRVFDRFSQGERAESRGVRGLGIGLAIVRELVEAHGGAVEASSPGEGLGATFTVTLPGRVEMPGPPPVRRGDSVRV
ncbi:MAG TPA: ATP-binding protein [Vicinamibacterales bacterium]